jgi:putative tryptophan/tyrosine transport system substrate-binding protein
MRRRDFIGLVGGAALAPISRALAQSTRVWRIGILETVPADRNIANLAALRRGLRELGYIEGQNLLLEYRSAEGRADRFPGLAEELVQLGVDLIVTRGAPAAKAARAATTSLPIVMAAIGEPLSVGIVEGLARPGGNATGLTAFVAELSGKRIELLKDAFPLIARVGFLQNIGNPASPPQWDAAQAAARALGLSVELFDVRGTDEIAAAFAKMAARGIDAVSVGIDALTQANAAMIVELAAERRLPAVYPAREFVELGGLFSYGPSYPNLYFRAAALIDKIFKGVRPGDLPVKQPDKFELVINFKTLKILDLALTKSMLARADGAIE